MSRKTIPGTPAIGGAVHYVSYGTPGGEFLSECRAAIVTAIDWDTDPSGTVLSLAVLNPGGVFFNRLTSYASDAKLQGGTWHWIHYAS